ncbi:unnamed protein product, partial [Phaeothamnion confervicola]
DLLRRPLQEFGLFPQGRDPKTSPITTEELKKLVRHWRLHEGRGFWKAHPERDDLARVLLKHI